VQVSFLFRIKKGEIIC